MKTNEIFSKIFLLLITAFTLLRAQAPTYQSTIKNDVQTGPNTYEFDIYILRTGDVNFELAGFQAGLLFNPGTLNGGTLSWGLVTGTSEFNSLQVPSSFSVDPTNGVLRMAARSIPDPGQGTIISNIPPGTKAGRFRITLNGSSNGQFANTQMNLRWNFEGSPYYPTRVNALVDGLSVNITTPSSHFLDLSNPPLPVELVSFTAKQGRKCIILEWTTATETNNYGFEIERITSRGSWEKIGFIQGKGNSNSPQKYSFSDNSAEYGKLQYRLKQVDLDGKYNYSNNVEIKLGIPNGFVLDQNFPNPFNPATKIKFGFSLVLKVSLKVYDILGNEISTLFDDLTEPDRIYVLEFGIPGDKMIASGIYIYRLEAPGISQVKKMIFMK